jgi:hypothetical protein
MDILDIINRILRGYFLDLVRYNNTYFPGRGAPKRFEGSFPERTHGQRKSADPPQLCDLSGPADHREGKIKKGCLIDRSQGLT